MSLKDDYLDSAIFEFRRYKALGEASFAQLDEEDILWKHGANDNNIALIVKHLSGNMLSRWTNFLTEDGEKSWRDRENEFKEPYTSKKKCSSLGKKDGPVCSQPWTPSTKTTSTPPSEYEMKSTPRSKPSIGNWPITPTMWGKSYYWRK